MTTQTFVGQAPKIKISNHARRLPAAKLGSHYSASLEHDADDGKFVPMALAPGLSISAAGEISGTLNSLGPHRFEVCVDSPTRGKGWASFAISAANPQSNAPAPAASGVSVEQVQALLRAALDDHERDVQARIAAAVEAERARLAKAEG